MNLYEEIERIKASGYNEQNAQAKLLIDDEAQHIRYDNAEQAGYEFEKGRQRAQEEYYAQAQQNPQVVYEEPPKKRKTFHCR